MLGALLPASIFGRVVLGGLAAGAVGLAVAAVVRHLRDDNDASTGAKLLTPADATGRAAGDVRVMSFNIKAAHGVEVLGDATPAERERNLREIAAYIERVDPDVVLLQEVEQDYPRGGTYPMFDRLRTLLHASDGSMSESKIGAAIITRNGYSIRDRADGTNQVHSRPVDGSSVMTAAIAPPNAGTTFTVVNGHVRPGTLAGLAARVDAVRDGSLTPTDPFPRRVLVGGDFNTTTAKVDRALDGTGGPVTDVLAHMGVSLTDALRRMTSPTPFGNTPWSVADRDQIHLSSGFGTVTHATIMDPRYTRGPYAGTPLSDHRPIIADVRLSNDESQ